MKNDFPLKRAFELSEAVNESYAWLHFNPYHPAAPLMQAIVIDWDTQLQDLPPMDSNSIKQIAKAHKKLAKLYRHLAGSFHFMEIRPGIQTEVITEIIQETLGKIQEAKNDAN